MPLNVFETNALSKSAYPCDVHTHTLASRHAYSTIMECAAVAKARGLALVGSTDHYSCMISETVDVRDYQHFINFEVWPDVIDGVRVLHGVEADIVDLEGNLFGWDIRLPYTLTGHAAREGMTLKGMVMPHADYVIASIHDDTFCEGASLSETTAMYIGALEQPEVAILGHIGRSGVPFDLDEVLIAARDLHKLIEINEHSFADRYDIGRRTHCRDIAVRCAELGVSISVGTDAHIATDVGDFRRTHALLTEIDFPEELNACADMERFLSYVPTVRS